jgi:hypothetical protein
MITTWANHGQGKRMKLSRKTRKKCSLSRRGILPLGRQSLSHCRVTPGRFYFLPQLLPLNSDGSKLRIDATLLRAAVEVGETTAVDWLEPVLFPPAPPEPLPTLLAVRAPALVVVGLPPAEEFDSLDWFVVATGLEPLRSLSNELLRVPVEADASAGDCGVLDPDGAAISAEVTDPDTPDAPLVTVALSGVFELCADAPADGFSAR